MNDEGAPTIAPHPEITLHGAKSAMQVNIVECNAGGFIIIVDGATAGRTTWGEALEFIAEHGVKIKSWGIGVADGPLPEGINPTIHRPERQRRRLLHSLGVGMLAFLGARSTA